jgi:hypothetical protein
MDIYEGALRTKMSKEASMDGYVASTKKEDKKILQKINHLEKKFISIENILLQFIEEKKLKS